MKCLLCGSDVHRLVQVRSDHINYLWRVECAQCGVASRWCTTREDAEAQWPDGDLLVDSGMYVSSAARMSAGLLEDL